MILKIRFPQGRQLQHRRGKNRELSAAFGALLVPASLMAYSLGFWRLASDIGLTAQFDITGVFSHWQVWIGLGVILHAAAISLNRHARGGALELPHALSLSLGRPDLGDPLDDDEPVAREIATSVSAGGEGRKALL